MRQYLDLLDHVLTTTAEKSDRTGTGTLSVFGHQMRFDLADGFPLVTTKKLHPRSIFDELLWFLRGDTNVRWLQERGVTIWDEWADARRRPRPGLRLPVALVADARRRGTSTRSPRSSSRSAPTPTRRRLIVSAWNVADIATWRSPPCHTLFQFYVAPGADGRRRSRASSTSAPPTSSSACRSTSRPTPC